MTVGEKRALGIEESESSKRWSKFTKLYTRLKGEEGAGGRVERGGERKLGYLSFQAYKILDTIILSCNIFVSPLLIKQDFINSTILNEWEDQNGRGRASGKNFLNFAQSEKLSERTEKWELLRERREKVEYMI